MNKAYYFLNIVSNDLDRILSFSKIAEESCDTDTLSGLNFAETFDGKFLLGLTFTKENTRNTFKEIAEKNEFPKILLSEVDWISILSQSNFSVIGNFTYKMLKGADL